MADSLTLVSGGDDIKIWGWPELKTLHTLKPHTNAISSLTWSPNNHFLASTALGDSVVVTAFNKPAPTSIELQGCEDDTCLAFNSSSRLLITAGKNKVVNVWDLKNKLIKKKIKNNSDAINCVKFNWNDTNIVTGNTMGDILVHSVSTTLTSTPLRLPQTQAVHAIQYSRFKKALLGAVSDDGALNIWDTNTMKMAVSFPDNHTAPARDLSFSPMNDMLLASVGLDKKIVFYDILGKKMIKDMNAESPLTSISFMHDGAAFAVGTTCGRIFVYDLRSGSTPLNSTVAHKSSVQSVSFQLPKGNTSSSSATLAAKLTSRSSSDSATKRDAPPPLPPGIPGKPRVAATEPVQNGGQPSEGIGMFSPLREDMGAGVAKELNSDDYEQMNTKKPEHITASGVFSPINSSSLSYHPPISKSDPTPTLNGHTASSTYGDTPHVTRQPGGLPMTTSQVSKRDSITSHGAETTGRDRYKGTLTRKVSADKHSMTGSNQRKPSSTISQISTSHHHSQATDSGPDKLDEMGSSRGSREVLNGFIQPTRNNEEEVSGFHEYQVQFMKNLIDDALDEFRIDFHQDIVNLQVEMLRQFQIQQNEMKALLQQYSLNDALVAENERLKEEIKKLKSTH
ncbi:protein NEDD1-like isoform X2 [Dendronephthya gigantea]|uniref:protein NEDD1-like isoform X2 n=1 Tax=Dendronephthya gigantea TaxID=151771 RepID=UPI00106D15F1|nr:protein NEDD1-like isoform X2 [Dendronephthya gigantea]